MRGVPAFQSALNTALTLLGLCALAVALPLLTILGEAPTFFVVHDAKTTSIVQFALTVFLLPPAFLLVTLFLGRWRAGLVHALVGLLLGLWLLGHLSNWPAWGALACALVFSLMGALLHARVFAVRSFMVVLGWVSPLVLASFFFLSPVSKLLFSQAGVIPGLVAGKQTPVVFLLLDELSQAVISLPSGAIDTQRLPNFARLAALSTWYGNTTTVSTQTERAVPAILSGLRVDNETHPVLSQFPQNLFTSLAATHEISAQETVSRLCPRRVCRKGNLSAIRLCRGSSVTLCRCLGRLFTRVIACAMGRGLAALYYKQLERIWPSGG
jgi:hypothetical protein